MLLTFNRRITITFALILIALVTQLNAQSSKELSNSDPTFSLLLTITNQKSSKGSLYAQLFDSKGETIQNVIQPMVAHQDSGYTFKGLAAGKYAIRVFHDANNNGKLDKTIIGIPKERFGFSNNVMGKMGPPSFNEQLFEVKADQQLKIILKGR